METSQVSRRAKQCLERFQGLHNALTASKDNDHFRPIIRESSERFAVWAPNLGTCHEPSDHRPADYRLREATSISRLIAQTLDELLDVLKDAADIVDGSQPDASLLEEAGAFDYPEDEEGIPDTEESELGKLCAMTSDITTSLLKVSILIRQSTDRDRYAKAAASRDPPFLRDIDIRRIGERFPKIRDKRQPDIEDESDDHAWLREDLAMPVFNVASISATLETITIGWLTLPRFRKHRSSCLQQISLHQLRLPGRLLKFRRHVRHFPRLTALL